MVIPESQAAPTSAALSASHPVDCPSDWVLEIRGWTIEGGTDCTVAEMWGGGATSPRILPKTRDVLLSTIFVGRNLNRLPVHQGIRSRWGRRGCCSRSRSRKLLGGNWGMLARAVLDCDLIIEGLQAIDEAGHCWGKPVSRAENTFNASLWIYDLRGLHSGGFLTGLFPCSSRKDCETNIFFCFSTLKSQLEESYHSWYALFWLGGRFLVDDKPLSVAGLNTLRFVFAYVPSTVLIYISKFWLFIYLQSGQDISSRRMSLD